MFKLPKFNYRPRRIKKTIYRSIHLLLSLSLLFQSFYPLALIVNPVRAQESEPIVLESSSTPTLTTDKLDYAPADTVYISGTFYQPLTDYNILISSNDEPTVYHEDDLDSDADGNVYYSYTLDGIYRPLYKVEVFLGDLLVASTTFTDANIGLYDQCANYGGDGYDSGDTGCRWTNGNLNGNNSTYTEGDATVQRVWLTGYEPGSYHTLTLQYGTTKGGKHAYDFLTNWDWSENWITTPDLCQDITGCETATPTLSPDIPADPMAGGFDLSSRKMEIRGGEITAISTPSKVSGDYTADSETAITIHFTVDNDGSMCDSEVCSIALFFGAHIAKEENWGLDSGATSISGSPYHVALDSVDGDSVGQRDNQMQASAVVSEGNIVIVKETLPDQDTTEFTFNPSWSDLDFTLSDGESEDSQALEAGQYSIEEIVPAGWALTDVTCISSIQDNETYTDLELDAGETITCTFTNTKLASITVVKDTIYNQAQDFTFHNDFGYDNPDTFYLDDDSNGTLPKQMTFYMLPGTYNIYEDPVEGFQQESATCDNEDSPSAVTVGAGESVTCTFVNEELSTIILVKNTVGGDGSFEFNLTGDGLPSSETLSTFEGTDSVTYDGLDQDNTYTIEEVVPSGWDLTSASCDNGDLIDAITPDPGETITCTFENTARGMIIVDKLTDPSESEDLFDFNLSGDHETNVDFKLSDLSDPFNSGYILAGSYSVTESDVNSWYHSNTQCTSSMGHEESANSLDLNPGEVITCVFTNTEIEELDISKTVNTSYRRTFGWEIDKSVSPESWDLFNGDTGESEYTVKVTKDEGTDSDFKVWGVITINNPNELGTLSATITSVEDVVSGVGGLSVDCGEGITFPHELSAGSTLICEYTGNTPDSQNRTNTATVNTEGLVPGDSTQEDVTFGDPSQFMYDEVTVNDTNGESWIFDDDGQVFYSRTFACNDDEGVQDNVATINETGDSDDASVTVNCYDLAVTKDAIPSNDRTWQWDIDKSSETSQLTLSAGQEHSINYSVEVGTTGYEDSNWAVLGTITISNPNPVLDAELTSVSDLISPDIIGVVDCAEASVVPAGDSIQCSYSSELPDAQARTNTATATLQNYDYNEEDVPTPSSTTDFSGVADIDFAGSEITEYDECVSVDDDLYGLLGDVCVNQAPVEFNYSIDVGPYDVEQCGIPQQVDNTASFVTNDTETTADDSWRVDVTVACTCSLTQGYWKTHSEKGPAPYDDTWAILGGADTDFFLDDQSYYDVLWTSPRKGNAYYILAHQYIAAELNQLNGAYMPAPVQEAFDQATAVFELETPEDIEKLKGKNGKQIREELINLAGILGDFNEGISNPAGHCSE